MTTLTAEQEQILVNKIENLRSLTGKKALIRNDSIFKFLCALNSNGFIDGTEFDRLDRLRYEALMKIRRAE